MDRKVAQHFKKNDPTLFAFIGQVQPIGDLKGDLPKNYFFRLCKEIACQQLSGKAGKVIFERFKNIFPGKIVIPQAVLKVSHETLRNSGISHAKARYVRNLAEHIVSGELDFKKFKNLSNEQIVEKLTKVKGIGNWTAEMFLMFTMAREDVFSHGDLGLRKGIMKVYNLRKEPSRERIEKIISRWSPYKTYGCKILWGAISLKQ
ncbi:MAG: DNA-3-methyladenine glycosylase 2 family protein [Patescibacteria group bacterium]|nr:DNA-3-methyladenine glycosylase 2 family protein [Patescibacteria group bacterium]